MNPQKNLLQQLTALQYTCNARGLGLYTRQTGALFRAGSMRVVHLAKDCLDSVAPLAIRRDLMYSVHGALEYVSAFSKTRRRLRRLMMQEFVFNSQVSKYLASALEPLLFFLEENNWGNPDTACLLYNEEHGYYRLINFRTDSVVYCDSPIDATIIFSLTEAEMVVASLKYLEAQSLHPRLLSEVISESNYFATSDYGSPHGPKEILQEWREAL